jgi:hypothetical protein
MESKLSFLNDAACGGLKRYTAASKTEFNFYLHIKIFTIHAKVGIHRGMVKVGIHRGMVISLINREGFVRDDVRYCIQHLGIFTKSVFVQYRSVYSAKNVG